MAFWNRKKETEERTFSVSVADPAFLEFFGLGRSITGQQISETSVLGLSAVWRAVNLIAGTIASLPLKTFQTLQDGTREQVGSFIDNPAGPDSLTSFEWKEMLIGHLILYGNAFGIRRRNDLGATLGLELVHPSNVAIRQAAVFGNKIFTITTADSETAVNTVELTSRDVVHFTGFMTDGIRGIGLIQIAKNSLGISQAAEVSAGRQFASGALVSGIVTPKLDEEVDEEDAKKIKASFRNNVLGANNAGDIAFINRALDFQKWEMTNEEAQFLQARAFQVEEIARWTGVAPHLLMQTEKQTSWGTGIEEQHRALGRHTLKPWSDRVEQRISTLLRSPKFAEFDFAGLEQPNAKDEITLLINQVNAGLLTLNEARRIRNLPPVDGGNEPRGLAGDPTRPQLEQGENLEESV